MKYIFLSILIFLCIPFGKSDKERVAEYFSEYGETTFYIHKPHGVDTLVWVGSFEVRGNTIVSRTLSDDSTHVAYVQTAKFNYPVTYSIKK